MSRRRLDVGFVPVECPGSTGTGATHTSALLIEHLSRRHDLTVYVSSQRHADPEALPARDRVEYVLHDDLAWLPHPIEEKQAALESELPSMEHHDLVHSYSSAFIPVLADLDAPVLVTLNSYLAICPKADYRYHGKEQCTGPGALKCTGCIPATALNRRQGVVSELKSGYFSMGRIPLVGRSIHRANDIDHYQALSPHVRRDHMRVGFDGDRIEVIPHFYDERFLVGADAGHTDPEAPITLLYVGALKDIKGVDVLIEAVSRLVDRNVDVELQVAGSGPMGDRLRRLAAARGITETVDWLGYVEYEELPALYRAADVFVYPGLLDEPFGRVMLEAMASKTPIVSSDIGSMRHIVGPTGELFEPGDPDELALAVEAVLADYPRYRAEIEDHLPQFAPNRVINRFDDLYHRTVRRGRDEAQADRRQLGAEPPY